MRAVVGDDAARFIADERQRVVGVKTSNISALRSHPPDILPDYDRRLRLGFDEIGLIDTRVVRE